MNRWWLLALAILLIFLFIFVLMAAPVVDHFQPLPAPATQQLPTR